MLLKSSDETWPALINCSLVGGWCPGDPVHSAGVGPCGVSSPDCPYLLHSFNGEL